LRSLRRSPLSPRAISAIPVGTAHRHRRHRAGHRDVTSRFVGTLWWQIWRHRAYERGGPDAGVPDGLHGHPLHRTPRLHRRHQVHRWVGHGEGRGDRRDDDDDDEDEEEEEEEDDDDDDDDDGDGDDDAPAGVLACVWSPEEYRRFYEAPEDLEQSKAVRALVRQATSLSMPVAAAFAPGDTATTGS
jgi:hypothetical protein